jgi:hypothetical protein
VVCLNKIGYQCWIVVATGSWLAGATSTAGDLQTIPAVEDGGAETVLGHGLDLQTIPAVEDGGAETVLGLGLDLEDETASALPREREEQTVRELPHDQEPIPRPPH